jgi:predicted negative regulator of RcsB-dependent stress response
VLDEGVAAKMVDPAQGQVKDLLASAKRRATSAAALKTLESKAASAPSGAAAMEAADAFFGHGEYAKAAALYRSAIQKGSVDTDLANSRLGMALALAGQKAEAETALRAVAGARTNLASLWLIWLGQRG